MTQHAQYGRRWSKRLLGMAIAVPMTLAGLVTGAATWSTATAADTSSHLVAQYEFNKKPTDEKTVVNTANTQIGSAVVQQSSDALWKDGALTLQGGDKNQGDWVRLPDNILSGKTSATIQTEVKADASMLNTFHFLFNIGNDSNAEYVFSALKCGDRSPLVGIKSAGKETLVQSGSCSVAANRWISVAAVLDGDSKTGSLYIDGVQVSHGAIPATPADVKDQSLNTIGRSPWPDPLFKGQIATFRVYDAALSQDQIVALSNQDAVLHQQEITGYAKNMVDNLQVPATVDSEYVPLSTENGVVSWTSSDPHTISEQGKVNQPAKGSQAKQVTLTATANIRGLSAQKQFTVTVNPTEKTAATLVQEAATSYVIPSVMRGGDSLPKAVDGTGIDVVSSQGVGISDNQVLDDVQSATQATISVNVSRDGVIDTKGQPITVQKTFKVKVLPKSDSTVLAAYDRVPTNANEANNGDIAYSMHLAKQEADGTYSPYNENYGIFFARLYKALPKLEDTRDWSRSIKDPALFVREDGSYGIIAVRTNRGTDVADARGSVLIATSKDLLSYNELENSGSIIDLGETNGVHNPRAVWDGAAQQYVVTWNDDAGIAKHTTFADLTTSDDAHGDVLIGAASMVGDLQNPQGIDNFRSGMSIVVDNAVVQGLDTRFARIENTGYQQFDDVTINQGASLESDKLPTQVTLRYSDGSTRQLPIASWDTSKVDSNKAGEYTAVAKVKQTDYQIPFAEDRADPSVYKWQWKHAVNGKEVTETKFLMIATNDIYGDNVWQHGSSHMPLRMADSIEGLADNAATGDVIDANGFNPKETTILNLNDKDSEGNPITHSFWAPEIHEINGRLTILFMAGYGNQWTDGKSVYMQLKQDASGHDLNPMNPANWEAPVPIYRPDGSPLATMANGNVGMSLDMTYFKDGDGQSYYAWQQLGATYIAKMDPSNPARTTSYPVRIVTPEYPWNVTIAEGPNVTLHNGKLYLMFSGSGVGITYTTGLAVANATGSDLTDPASWQVLNYPIQKSGPFNGKMQLGTGHGMWSEDEDGNQIYVFHAYADQHLGSTNATGRDMFVRRVHWAADDYPIFDMSLQEELDPALSVTLKVKVVAAESGDNTEEPDGNTDPTNPSKDEGTKDEGSQTDPAGQTDEHQDGHETHGSAVAQSGSAAESKSEFGPLAATGAHVGNVIVIATIALFAGVLVFARRRRIQ